MRTNLFLFPRSRSSFDVNNIEGFAAWLAQRGYRHEQTRNNLTEYARLHGSNNGLVTIYRSGAVVLGGPADGQAATRALLCLLVLQDDTSCSVIQTRLLL
jgi:hypothetical protein